MTRTGSPAYRDPVRFHAARTPGRLALLDLASGRAQTYAELDRRTDGLAGHLRARGLAAGDRVAILARNTPAFFELQFAASRLGVAVVPLNLRLAAEEVAFILGDCAPAMLIYDVAIAETAKALAGRCGLAHLLAIDLDDPDCEYERAIAAPAPDAPDHPATHDDVCLIIYTSGTTGRPKGALITHGVVFWQSVNSTGPCRLTSSTVELVMLPLFHIAGMNANANPTLRLGGSVLIQRSFDAGETLRLLSDPDLGVNCLTGVTAQYQFMAAHEGFEAADLSRLTYAGVGGSPTPAALLKIYAERGVPLCEGFGMTEAGPGVCTLGTADLARKRGSVGKPLMHVDVRLVADGRDVPEGEIGELWLQAPNIVPGYWRNPEATADSFVEGYWRSGDIGVCDADGFVTLLDRAKDLVNRGGFKIFSVEVENVLAAHASVLEAAVVARPCPVLGERVHAFVVASVGFADAEALRRHAAAQLADYKVPETITFLGEPLPRNAGGKVLKRDLRRMLAE